MPQNRYRPGELDQRIEIIRVTTAADGQGGYTRSESTFKTLWAHVRPRGGREQREHGKVEADATYIFTVRFRSDLTEKDIIRWNGDDYNIRNLLPRTTRSLYLEIEGERGVTT